MGLFLLPCPPLHGFSANSWHLPGKALRWPNPTTWLFIIHNEDAGHVLEKVTSGGDGAIASPPSLEVVCPLTLWPHHTSLSSFPDNRPLAVQRRRIKPKAINVFCLLLQQLPRSSRGMGLLLCLIPHELPTTYRSAGQ